MNTVQSELKTPNTEREETVDADKFVADVLAGLQDGIEWACNEKSLQTSSVIEGSRLPPEYLTRAETEQRMETADWQAVFYDAGQDTIEVRLTGRPIQDRDESRDDVIINYDSEGGIVSFELRSVSRIVSQSNYQAATSLSSEK